MSDNTVPVVTGADYGRMASAAVALATDDRDGFNLVLRDAQQAGRSLEFVVAPLSIVARTFDLYDGGPEAIDAFRQKIASLIAQADEPGDD